MVGTELEYLTTEEILKKEFEFYKKAPGKLGSVSCKNEIVKFFQQDSFFVIEKELWKDEKIREQLIKNRCKYLNKTEEELIDNDILTGFKKSGMYYGYSHFNPLWFKWFIEKYNVKTCADPFGGWGHRLLGAINLEKYIYNDLSTHTAQGVLDMVNYFDMDNVEVYNDDAEALFSQTAFCNFEAIFTCPPYFNLEHYECGDFEDYEAYDWKMDSIKFAFEMNPNTRVMGMVIREDYLPQGWDDYTEKFQLNVHKAEHLLKDKQKKNKEYMYVWIK